MSVGAEPAGSDAAAALDLFLAEEISVVAKGLVLRALAMGAGLVLALPSSAILVRSLGVSGYGALSFATAVVGIGAIVADLGLGVGISRMSSHRESEAPQWARTGAVTGLLTGAMAAGIVLLIARFVHGPTRLAMEVSAPAALFAGMRSVLAGPLTAKRRIGLLESTLGAQNFAYYGGGIVLGALGVASVGRVAFVQTVAVALGAVLILPAWRRLAAGAGRVSGERWRELVGFSVPLLMTGVAAIVLQRSDVVLLGALRDPHAVGLYAPVLKLVDVANVALIALGSYYIPVTTRLVAQGRMTELRSVYTAVAKWCVVLSGPLLVTLMVEPDPLLRKLFGRPFAHSGTIALALSLGYALNILAGTNGLTLVALGKARQIGIRSALMVVGNLALNAILIPKFGALGAAIGTGVVYASVNVANSVLIYRAARIHPVRPDFVAVVVSVALAGVIGYVGTVVLGLRDSLWGSLGVLVWTGIAGLTAAVVTATKEERSVLRILRSGRA